MHNAIAVSPLVMLDGRRLIALMPRNLDRLVTAVQECSVSALDSQVRSLAQPAHQIAGARRSHHLHNWTGSGPRW